MSFCENSFADPSHVQQRLPSFLRGTMLCHRALQGMGNGHTGPNLGLVKGTQLACL